MENTRKEKRSTLRPTSHQIDLMVNYMATHSSFANGEFGGPMGAETNLQQWRELKSILDKNGPIRSVDQWRTTWRDKKRRAREEGAKINTKRRETGNLTQVPNITTQSSVILGVIGHASATGLEAEPETRIGQSMVMSYYADAEADEVVVQSEEPTVLEEYISELDETMHMAQHIPTPTAAPLPAFLPGPTPQAPRQNKLRPAAFLQAEESSRAVLKEIRNALQLQNIIAERQNRQRRLKRLDSTKRRPFKF